MEKLMVKSVAYTVGLVVGIRAKDHLLMSFIKRAIVEAVWLPKTRVRCVVRNKKLSNKSEKKKRLAISLVMALLGGIACLIRLPACGG